MNKYKGHYIDNRFFHNKEEVDAHIRAEDIKAFQQACKYFAENKTVAYSIYLDECAERLVNSHGFTWEEIERLEAEAA